MRNIWQETKEDLEKNYTPFSIVLELTRVCNLNCIHCYNIKDKAELSFAQIKKIASSLRKAGTLTLTLTGGEVFVIKDILEILYFLKGLGFDLKIITNGTLLNKDLIKHLKSIYPSEIGVSLYGLSPLVHEKITRVRGSFQKTFQTIKALKEEGLPVHIKTTLMKENFEEYPKIREFSQKLGLNYLLDPIISPKDDGSKSVLKHRLSFKKLREFYWEEFERIEDFEKRRCDAGFNFGAISAEGRVYPCIQFPWEVGNVFREDFKKIWEESEVLRRFRERVNRGFSQCSSCELYSYCSYCPGLSFLENRNPFSCYRLARFMAKVYKEYCEVKV